MDVAGRIPRLRERFDDAGIDALLVTRLPNVRYLTGFTGSAGMLLVTAADALLVTDGRYQDQAGGAARRGRRATRGVDIGTTQARQREILQALARRDRRASGSRRTAVTLGPAARVRRRVVPRTPS